MENSLYIWLIIGLFVGIICFAFLSIINWLKDRKLLQTVTSLERGTSSERKLILKLLKAGVPPSDIFHDLYVEKYKNNYSQIDVVITTKVGIIVFEIKDYSGWIFGNGFQTYWMQVLAYGKEKYRFYNPIMQNNGHIEALRRKLKQCADVPFYSIIVFYGSCILTNISSIPDGIYLAYPDDTLCLINSLLESNAPTNYIRKRDAVNILKEAVNNGANPEIRIQHIKNIRQRFFNRN